MVTIARQHHDDARMAPIFRELAEDRTEALEQVPRRNIAAGGHPRLLSRCGRVPIDDTRGDGCTPVGADGELPMREQSSDVIATLRRRSSTYYADAIEVIVQNGDYASQELRDLENQAVRSEQVAVRTGWTAVSDATRHGNVRQLSVARADASGTAA